MFLKEKSLGILTVAICLACPPAFAQYVKSVSIDVELDRLVRACVQYSQVGQTAMPDMTRYGYKIDKLGYGTEYVAGTSLDGSVVDPEKLKKGTGLGTSLRWAPARGHTCTVSIAVRLEQDINMARAFDDKVHKIVQKMGFRKQEKIDSRNRPYFTFDKGVDQIGIVGKVNYTGKTRNNSTIWFVITNENSTARKN